MPFAYRDRYGILHAAEDEATAKEYAHSKIVEYDGVCSGGYPGVVVSVFDYGNGRVFVGGNEKSGLELFGVPSTISGEVGRLLDSIAL